MGKRPDALTRARRHVEALREILTVEDLSRADKAWIMESLMELQDEGDEHFALRDTSTSVTPPVAVTPYVVTYAATPQNAGTVSPTGETSGEPQDEVRP